MFDKAVFKNNSRVDLKKAVTLIAAFETAFFIVHLCQNWNDDDTTRVIDIISLLFAISLGATIFTVNWQFFFIF